MSVNKKRYAVEYCLPNDSGMKVEERLLSFNLFTDLSVHRLVVAVLVVDGSILRNFIVNLKLES